MSEMSTETPGFIRRRYDKTNVHWSSNPLQNEMFIRTIQSYVNERIFTTGFVTLNQVYESLGFELTEMGALCGWTRGHDALFQLIDQADDGSIEIEFNISSGNVFRDK